MASELSVSAGISVNSTTMNVAEAAIVTVSQAALGVSHGDMTLTTTPGTALPLGSIGTLGYCWFKNLDGSIIVSITAGSGGTVIATLKAGEPACFRWPTGASAPYAYGASGTPKIRFLLCEA